MSQRYILNRLLQNGGGCGASSEMYGGGCGCGSSEMNGAGCGSSSDMYGGGCGCGSSEMNGGGCGCSSSEMEGGATWKFIFFNSKTLNETGKWKNLFKLDLGGKFVKDKTVENKEDLMKYLQSEEKNYKNYKIYVKDTPLYEALHEKAHIGKSGDNKVFLLTSKTAKVKAIGEDIKSAAEKTGTAIKSAAVTTGTAIKSAAEKTGKAISDTTIQTKDNVAKKIAFDNYRILSHKEKAEFIKKVIDDLLTDNKRKGNEDILNLMSEHATRLCAKFELYPAEQPKSPPAVQPNSPSATGGELTEDAEFINRLLNGSNDETQYGGEHLDIGQLSVSTDPRNYKNLENSMKGLEQDYDSILILEVRTFGESKVYGFCTNIKHEDENDKGKYVDKWTCVIKPKK